MSAIDWKRFLQQHPVFSDLSDEEISALLSKDVVVEKCYDQGQSIMKQGDQDEAIFLIGEGSASVFMKGPNEQDVYLNCLGKGELFGEMALFEHKPRSATVTATEPCTVLEFYNREFLKLLQHHPGIGFKLLSRLSERLRDLGDKVLNTRLKDVDDKIKHVNAKLDTEIKIIDASLKATQTVFDQTSKRAHEVIDSADRSRSRFTIAASTIGSIFTLIFSILSYMGYSKLHSINNIAETIEDKSRNISQKFEDLKILSEKAMAYSESIETTNNNLIKVQARLDETNQQMKNFYKKNMVAQFHSEMATDMEKAKKTFQSVLSFKDPEVSDALFRQILVEILNGDNVSREDYAEILKVGINTHNRSINGRQKILSYYLLLSTFVLNGDVQKYNENLHSYKKMLEKLNNPVKETVEVDFGAAVFEEYLIAESDTVTDKQIKKIEKINNIWSLVP